MRILQPWNRTCVFMLWMRTNYAKCILVGSSAFARRYIYIYNMLIDWLIHYSAFRQQRPCTTRYKCGSGYNTLLLRMILGDISSACHHRQFHTLPDLLDSRAALSNPYLNTCLCGEPVCTIFMMVFGMTRPGREPQPTVRGWHANH